jgi:deoxyribonuclease IV
MKELLFGTAGIPVAAKGGNTLKGIEIVRKLGLGAMELEFVRGVNISKENTLGVEAAAQQNSIVLTCHAPYFINLNAQDRAKLAASRQRLLNAASTAALCGAWSTCVHAAYYLKLDKDRVYENVRKELASVVAQLKAQEHDIWVRPETAGRASQFGTLTEILKLSAELDNVMPCIDFGHLHALEGKNNTYKEFAFILAQIEKVLGKEGLHNMHIHTEGISYGGKGERSHTNLKDSDMDYAALAKAWKDFGVKGVVISESPNLESDALLLREAYEQN